MIASVRACLDIGGSGPSSMPCAFRSLRIKGASARLETKMNAHVPTTATTIHSESLMSDRIPTHRGAHARSGCTRPCKRSLRLGGMATRRTGKRRRPATHNAELWAHIEPESSRLLLLSALDAFLARGYHAATTREIAERAGMSPAAVYVHWKAKSDLLFEISRIGHQAVLDVVEQALEQASDDPVERVHAFVSAFATLACGQPCAGTGHPVRVQEAAAAPVPPDRRDQTLASRSS